MASYGTLANLKLRLNITTSSDDSLLTDALASASRKVEDLAGRSWASGTVTQKYGVGDSLIDEDKRLLYLDGLLTSIATLTNGDGVVITGTNYVLLPRNEALKNAILLTKAGGYLWSFGSSDDGEISVNSTTWTVPENVAEAAYVIAEALYRRGEKGAPTLQDSIEDARKLLATPLGFGAL